MVRIAWSSADFNSSVVDWAFAAPHTANVAAAATASFLMLVSSSTGRFGCAESGRASSHVAAPPTLGAGDLKLLIWIKCVAARDGTLVPCAVTRRSCGGS